MTTAVRLDPVVYLAIVFALLTGQTSSFGAYRKDLIPVINSETFQYYETEYVFNYGRVTWDEAVAICPSINGHLATVDTIEKAKFLAETISDSNIRIEDIWVGGRQINNIWVWVETGASLPVKPEINGFPPWVYSPDRIGKECLAMDRKGHDDPIFVDVSCKQPRPYICERSLGEDNGEPKAARTVRYGDNFYTLYHGRLTWNDAVAYCRQNGKRLAVVNNNNIASVLSQAMTKSRPDFESAWVGGRYLYGTWRWAPTGEEIPPKMDHQHRYPPWRNNSTRKNRGCVLFDRHLCNEAVFIDSKCHRTRDFICEESRKRVKGQTENPRFEYFNRTFELDPHNMTWDESNEACKDKGGFLVVIENPSMLEFITDLMSETGTEITHIWIGGSLSGKTWRWGKTLKEIEFPSNNEGFPPWCDNETRIDQPCLNLDRVDHSKPMLYGLECNNTQPFVCEVDCLDPEDIDFGRWHCTPPLSAKIRQCNIICDGNHMVFGSQSITCSLEGWVGDRQLPIAPQCVTFSGMAEILVEKLSMTIERRDVSSILFLLQDTSSLSDKCVAAEMEVVSSIVQSIPLAETFRGGVLVFGSSVMELVPMREENSCNIVRLASSILDRRVQGLPNFEMALRGAKEQIVKYGNKQEKTVIVIIASEIQEGGSFRDIYDDLYDQGHIFFVVNFGGEAPVKVPNSLVNMANLGPDDTLNYFFFDNKPTAIYNLGVTILNQSRSSEIDCSSFWKDNVTPKDDLSILRDNDETRRDKRRTNTEENVN